MVAAIVAAAGQGVRLGPGSPKALRMLAGRPLYCHALNTLQQVLEIAAVWLVVPPRSQDEVIATLGSQTPLRFPIHVIPGGDERQDSVTKAVDMLPKEVSLIVVHDAARPFASAQLFESCIAAARLHGAAIAALPLTDTVKLVESGVVQKTLDRTRTWVAQTPQVARAQWLRDALHKARDGSLRFTDEAGALEQCGYRVHVVKGEEWNRKLTTPDDWDWAEWFIQHRHQPRPEAP